MKIYLVKECETMADNSLNESIIGAWFSKDRAELNAASHKAGRYVSWYVEEVEIKDSPAENVAEKPFEVHPILEASRDSVAKWALAVVNRYEASPDRYCHAQGDLATGELATALAIANGCKWTIGDKGLILTEPCDVVWKNGQWAVYRIAANNS